MKVKVFIMKNVLIVILLSLGGLLMAGRADEAVAGRTHSLDAPQEAAARRVSVPGSIADKFRLALIEEETGQHLDTAIRAYQEVIAGLDDQRQMAVTAIFHLGECYRQQGKTNEAMTQYDRILRDFSEQRQVVDLARGRVAEFFPDRGVAALLDRPPGGTANPAFAPEQVRMVRAEIALVENQLVDLEMLFKSGHARLLELHKTQQDLLRLKRMLPENAAPASQKSLIQEQIKRVETRLPDLRAWASEGRGTRADVISLERELLGLQRELLAVTSTPPSLGGANESDAVTAEEAGEMRQLKAIVKDSPDLINAKNGEGKAPLHNAASAGHLAAVKYLIANAANPHAKDGLGRTALHAASECGHKSVVEFLLTQGADVNAKDGDGATPLLLAVDKGFKSVVQVFLDHQADVNVPGFIYRNRNVNDKTVRFHTPLEYALFRGRLDIARLLLSSKADPNATNYWGGTPIGSVFPPCSMDNEPDQAVELLVEYQANINWNVARDMWGWSGTPLHYAVRAGKETAAACLLTHGALPNLKDQSGDTPLHAAIRRNQMLLVELLLKHKADVNLAGQEGKTPLMLAREVDTTGLKGNTPSAPDQEVETDRDVSGSRATKGSPELEAMLRKYGATDRAKIAE